MTPPIYLPKGIHAVADCRGVAPELLSDLAFWREHTHRAAQLAGARVIRFDAHPFGEGQGIAGVLLLAESHLTFHTWPEHGFVALDAFMCGGCEPAAALNYLREVLGCTQWDLKVLQRGFDPDKA